MTRHIHHFAVISVVVFSTLSCIETMASASAAHDGTTITTSPRRLRTLIMLDVDNTLYIENEMGIESQIVANTHSYCQNVLNINKEKADDLYRRFGSTAEGLKLETWKDLPKNELHGKLDDFYHKVWKDVDVSKLLVNHDEESSSTGYSHSKDQKLICRLLKSSPLPICLASNSPSWHVKNVLRMMGLEKTLHGIHLFTPDCHPSFPSKHLPSTFFTSSLPNNEIRIDSYDNILLLDDSKHNLQQICKTYSNFEGIHIVHSQQNNNSLADALLKAFGLVDSEFEFNQIKYLQSKNVVDRNAMDSKTWNKVIDEMKMIQQTNHNGKGVPIRIVDLGAGLLSMLDLFLHGDTELHFKPLTGCRIDYTAYESNKALYENCHERLLSWGFSLKENVSDIECVYQKEGATIRFIVDDFSSSSNSAAESSQPPPHLVVGCCFADLLDPNQLVPSLIRSFNLDKTENTLLYFPITFCGTTQFLPPLPFEPNDNDNGVSTIPSDTLAFRLYSTALIETLGHNMDPGRLEQAMEGYGMTLMEKSSANWKIDPKASPYLFDTMMYFFGTAGGPQIMEAGWDAPGWISRSKQRRPKIQVSNVDLLFRAGRHSSPAGKESQNSQGQMKEILFTSPGEVTTTEKDIPTDLGPNQVLIQSSHSLISSGTELKIFKGLFDDAALDVNIKGMEEERMAYPLSYGYCLVGRIIKGGSKVPPDHIGKLAFSFAPHASHVVTDLEEIRLVPDGISAEDAIFMPSVETALSLTHDAHHRVGENVAVYGQGLIGLLVTAILSRGMQKSDFPVSSKFDTITAFDTIPDRLAASSVMGASQALLPGGTNGPFDVIIEVSGNGRALQSAIDQTSNGGRVIVGSWYGNSKVDLLLGIDFHRSHKTIQTSQVSEIPANLRGLWTKTRRFDLAWELVRQLKPSRLLTKTTTLKNAQSAYEALDCGTEIAVAFEYL